MAINKVEYFGTVLLDLTSLTVDASKVLSGTIAIDKSGTVFTGTCVVQKFYTGSSTPSSSLGNNGDLYLKV